MWVGCKPSARSNLAMVPKLFNWVSNLCETQISSGQVGAVSMGLRSLSSNYGNIHGENSRKEGVSEYNDSKNDGNDLGRGAQELDNTNSPPPQPIPGRPLRGEEQRPRFNQHQNVSRGKDFLSRGRDNGELRKQPDYPSVSGDRKTKFGSQDPVSDLFDRPKKAQPRNDDFLEKFRLSGDEKKESVPEEEPPQEEEEKDAPPQEADAIFKKMKETGLIPNAVAMLDGLCKDGLVKEAMKLFGQIREKGTMPDVIMYTAVVDGYLQAQRFEDAIRVFRKMQAKEITPNQYCYNVLVKGLIKCKRLEDAVDICVEMLDAGHTPNVATFTLLVDVFCTEKGVEEARKAIDALKQKGFVLDEKAITEHLRKKGPRSSMVREAIFGLKKSGPVSF